MSDVPSSDSGDFSGRFSGDESGHAAGAGPADPNEAVLRAKAPSPRALLLCGVAALMTTAGLVTAAIASAGGI